MSAEVEQQKSATHSTYGATSQMCPAAAQEPCFLRAGSATSTSSATPSVEPVTRNEDAEDAQHTERMSSQQGDSSGKEDGSRRALRNAVRECGTLVMAQTANLAGQ